MRLTLVHTRRQVERGRAEFVAAAIAGVEADRAAGREEAARLREAAREAVKAAQRKAEAAKAEVRGRSNAGQILVKYWTNTGEGGGARGAAEGGVGEGRGEILVKYRLNTGHIQVEYW